MFQPVNYTVISLTVRQRFAILTFFPQNYDKFCKKVILCDLVKKKF